MKISYRREIRHNYLILEPEEGSNWRTYETRMLSENRMDGVLHFQIRQSDDQAFFYYEITSKQPLNRLLEGRSIKEEQIRRLVLDIARILERMETFLLRESCILLEPEYIYVEPEHFRIWLCLVPGLETDFPEKFGKLLEYLLGKVDHQDKDSVVLAYGLYQETRKENYGMEDLLRLLGENGRKKTETMPDNPAEGEPCGEFWEPGKEDCDALKTETGGKFVRGSEHEPVQKTQKSWKLWKEQRMKPSPRRPEKKERESLFVKLKRLLGCKEEEPVRIPRELLEQSWGEEGEGRSDSREPWGRADRPDSREPWGRADWPDSREPWGRADRTDGWDRPNRTDGLEPLNCEVPGREAVGAAVNPPELPQPGQDTVLLADLSPREEVRLRRLTSLEGGEDIVLSYYPFIIGKQKNLVDYLLERDTVSRLHLRIDREGEGYYAQDLNSTNGSVVAGRQLEANESVRLDIGDEVSIAGIHYRFE